MAGSMKRPSGRSILIASATLSAAMMLYLVCSPADLRFLPNCPPRESDRIVHPRGFSIVAPPGWTADVVNSDEINTRTIRLSPKRVGRYAPIITVVMDGEPLGNHHRHEESTGAITFQGRPASQRVLRGNVGDNYPTFTSEMTFERDGLTFRLWYTSFSEMSEVPPAIQQYLDTFAYLAAGSGESALTTKPARP